MGEPARIVPVNASRLPVLADVLGRTFVEDPMIRCPISPEPDMPQRTRTAA
jgi:hypothetical protein